MAATLVFTAASQAQRTSPSANNNRDQRHIAGKFDYYQLALSWSPTHCTDNSRGRNDTQCGPRRRRPYGFVVHGLWPQYERGWPQYCPINGKPYVPTAIINSMMDIMPSRGLIIHQYKKHGTCSGLDAATYFKATRIAYNNVKIPAMFNAPKSARLMTTAELIKQFRSLNSTLPNDAVQIVCKRGNANRLKEIKFCITRKGAFRACTRSRTPRHKCAPNKKIYLPPVRG